MKYVLMNKNHKLLEFEYNESLKIIENNINFFDTDRLPYSLSMVSKESFSADLTKWLNNRYSKNSSWYKSEQWRFNYMTVDDLIIKSYGLSLSDQYWLKPSLDKVSWEEVNFFDNDFKYKAFVENMERVYDYRDVDVLYTPHITTGGELDKAWTINENNDRVLYKSSNTFYGLEPINEFIASKIGHILDIPTCDYDIKILSNLNEKTMVSACKTFITKDTELIPASEYFSFQGTVEEEYNEYIKILESHGIKDVKNKIDKMLYIDAVMRNPDRHLNNFGIIRNVETLEWLDVAPIFDTGRSLYTSYNQITDKQEFCLFSHTKATLDDIFSLIKDLKLTEKEQSALKTIPVILSNTLDKYKQYTNLHYYKEDLQPQLVNQLDSNISDSFRKLNLVNDKSDDYEL